MARIHEKDVKITAPYPSQLPNFPIDVLKRRSGKCRFWNGFNFEPKMAQEQNRNPS